MESNFSDFVEFPAFLINGKIMFDPDLRKASQTDLRTMADALGADIIMAKFHAAFTTDERLCVKSGCWRPRDLPALWCDTHVK